MENWFNKTVSEVEKELEAYPELDELPYYVYCQIAYMQIKI